MGSFLKCISAKIPKMKIQSGSATEFEMHTAAQTMDCDAMTF